MTSREFVKRLQAAGVRIGASTVRRYWRHGAPRSLNGFVRFYKGRAVAAPGPADIDWEALARELERETARR